MKGELLEQINRLEEEIKTLKVERKKHPRYILFKNLPEEHKFQKLKSEGKHLIDTIKMIAYRAETAMVSIIKEKMPFHSHGTARVLLSEIYKTEADIIADEANRTLTVKLHHLANRSSNDPVHYLCEELYGTETIYPGTDIRMIFELLS